MGGDKKNSADGVMAYTIVGVLLVMVFFMLLKDDFARLQYNIIKAEAKIITMLPPNPVFPSIELKKDARALLAYEKKYPFGVINVEFSLLNPIKGLKFYALDQGVSDISRNKKKRIYIIEDFYKKFYILNWFIFVVPIICFCYYIRKIYTVKRKTDVKDLGYKQVELYSETILGKNEKRKENKTAEGEIFDVMDYILPNVILNKEGEVPAYIKDSIRISLSFLHPGFETNLRTKAKEFKDYIMKLEAKRKEAIAYFRKELGQNPSITRKNSKGLSLLDSNYFYKILDDYDLNKNDNILSITEYFGKVVGSNELDEMTLITLERYHKAVISNFELEYYLIENLISIDMLKDTLNRAKKIINENKDENKTKRAREFYNNYKLFFRKERVTIGIGLKSTSTTIRGYVLIAGPSNIGYDPDKTYIKYLNEKDGIEKSLNHIDQVEREFTRISLEKNMERTHRTYFKNKVELEFEFDQVVFDWFKWQKFYGPSGRNKKVKPNNKNLRSFLPSPKNIINICRQTPDYNTSSQGEDVEKYKKRDSLERQFKSYYYPDDINDQYGRLLALPVYILTPLKSNRVKGKELRDKKGNLIFKATQTDKKGKKHENWLFQGNNKSAANTFLKILMPRLLYEGEGSLQATKNNYEKEMNKQGISEETKDLYRKLIAEVENMLKTQTPDSRRAKIENIFTTHYFEETFLMELLKYGRTLINIPIGVLSGYTKNDNPALWFAMTSVGRTYVYNISSPISALYMFERRNQEKGSLKKAGEEMIQNANSEETKDIIGKTPMATPPSSRFSEPPLNPKDEKDLTSQIYDGDIAESVKITKDGSVTIIPRYKPGSNYRQDTYYLDI